MRLESWQKFGKNTNPLFVALNIYFDRDAKHFANLNHCGKNKKTFSGIRFNLPRFKSVVLHFEKRKIISKSLKFRK